MSIANSMLDLVGKTPMVRLNRLPGTDCQAEVVGKLEFFNPASSVKDRIALGMIEAAEKSGQLRPGGVLIEPTSGNTGIGLAFVAAVKGYRLILVMPEHMSDERKTIVRGMGAELILTPAAKGMSGAVAEARAMLEKLPGAVMLNQFANPANPAFHRATTAEEIWADCAGKIDIFVSGVGTGGTIAGVSGRLKELNPKLHAVAVEPVESAVLSGNKPGPHKIQGIGAGFVPEVYNSKVVDEILQVSGDDSFACAKRLIKEEGIFCGISSGANAFAALSIAMRPESAGKRIVFVVCDTAERYLSTELFN